MPTVDRVGCTTRRSCEPREAARQRSSRDRARCRTHRRRRRPRSTRGRNEHGCSSLPRRPLVDPLDAALGLELDEVDSAHVELLAGRLAAAPAERQVASLAIADGVVAEEVGDVSAVAVRLLLDRSAEEERPGWNSTSVVFCISTISRSCACFFSYARIATRSDGSAGGFAMYVSCGRILPSDS